jgi:hypothetical protein
MRGLIILVHKESPEYEKLPLLGKAGTTFVSAFSK